MNPDHPARHATDTEPVFTFGETAPPWFPFLNRGKKPTIYFVVAAVLLIAFPFYMLIMFDFVAGPIAVVTAASILLLIVISRHYFSLVTEVRITHHAMRLRGFRKFREIPWQDLDSVTVSRQMDPDYVTFRLHPMKGQTLAVKKFRLWNRGAGMAGDDPVQGLINAIRMHLSRH